MKYCVQEPSILLKDLCKRHLISRKKLMYTLHVIYNMKGPVEDVAMLSCSKVMR